MPTNANVFNSRVTSEALEAKFRQVFPAQGGAELVQDLFASGVIQPVVDFSSVAEGSVLAPNLQTAWDLSTGASTVSNTTQTLISNTGFWRIGLNAVLGGNGGVGEMLIVGTTNARVWRFSSTNTGSNLVDSSETDFIVFLKAGESLTCQSNSFDLDIDVWWRQIADVNGNLVNPLGFTFS